jgi:hypothetical protein
MFSFIILIFGFSSHLQINKELQFKSISQYAMD